MTSASSTWTGPNPLNVAAPAARSASSLQGLSPQPSTLIPQSLILQHGPSERGSGGCVVCGSPGTSSAGL